MLDSGAESREELMSTKLELEAEMKDLSRELAAYSDDDLTELERKKREIASFRAEASEYTDQIEAMDGWFKNMLSGNDEALQGFRLTMYGDEYDEEEGGLQELV